MQGKIAFEEHMAIAETVGQTATFAADGDHWAEFSRQIVDLDNERIERMDANGIAYAVLSLNAPGVQAITDPAEALAVARKGNDAMAGASQRHPGRLGGFAAVPMLDVNAACEELTRCVREFGFKGAMLNGFQEAGDGSALYYDFPQFDEFWATVEELDVPVYIHPRMQLPARAQNYEGHNWMMSAPWGFAVETSIHALRLCGSEVFDLHPNVQVVIGHLGENIPFGLHRMNERMNFSRRGYRGRRLPGENFADHFHVTTSGNFSDPSFRCTIDVLGADRVCFSSDYPFEPMEAGCEWFDATKEVDEATKRQIGRENAIRLLKLDDLGDSAPSPAGPAM